MQAMKVKRMNMKSCRNHPSLSLRCSSCSCVTFWRWQQRWMQLLWPATVSTQLGRKQLQLYGVVLPPPARAVLVCCAAGCMARQWQAQRQWDDLEQVHGSAPCCTYLLLGAGILIKA